MNEDYCDIASELKTSSCLQMICGIGKLYPVDISNKHELKMAFSTVVIHMIRAIDKGEIEFGNDEASAMTHALLALAFDIVIDGKLAESVKMMRF